MNKLISSLFLTAALCGCGGTADKPENVKSTVTCSPIDYGNGVIYFPCNGAEFGNTLSTWRLSHPGAEIVGLVSDNTGIYGETRGYFMVVKTTR